MAENRWQIVVGAAMLLLILIIGSFSLGMYVGRHGLSQGGLRYQPAPPGDTQEPKSAGRAEDLPIGNPDVIGRIRALAPRGIQIATQEGPRLVEVNDSTRVHDANGKPLNLIDLSLGDIVAVFGEFSPRDGQLLLATHIVRLPPKPPEQP
jgi:hypothetical protein